MKPGRGGLLRTAWRGFGDEEQRTKLKERTGYLASPLWAPLSPDLCAVSVSSNQMAGGDIEVLADTRKHKGRGVSMAVPYQGARCSLGLGYRSGFATNLSILHCDPAEVLPQTASILAAPKCGEQNVTSPWAGNPMPKIHTTITTPNGEDGVSATGLRQPVCSTGGISWNEL